MRIAPTRAAIASSFKGEAVVPDTMTGSFSVTSDQLPAIVLGATSQASTVRWQAAKVVARRRCFSPAWIAIG